MSEVHLAGRTKAPRSELCSVPNRSIPGLPATSAAIQRYPSGVGLPYHGCMHTSALLLFSGGQDSTTCLAYALAKYERVETVSFDCGQRHRVELDARLAACVRGALNFMREVRSRLSFLSRLEFEPGRRALRLRLQFPALVVKRGNRRPVRYRHNASAGFGYQSQ